MRFFPFAADRVTARTAPTIEQVGYHLRQAEDWWEAVWNSARRSMVERIPPEGRDEFRRLHLERLSSLHTEDGLWMDVEVIVTRGRRNRP